MGAQAPEGDFCFADSKPPVAVRSQTRGLPDDAVDIAHLPARLAHEMVMVVASPPLVKGRRACRLELADQTGAGKVIEHHVDRLR